MTVPDRWIARAADAPRNYDTNPSVPLPDGARVLQLDDVWSALRARGVDGDPLVVVDCYPGVDVDALLRAAAAALPDWEIVNVEEAALSPADIDRLLAPQLTDDRVFGRMARYSLRELYDAERLAALEARFRERAVPTIVVGWGAALAASAPDVLVLADLARWEIQRRQRAGQPNWRCDNSEEEPLRKYKRGFFAEWRIADRHKLGMFDRVDFVLDTNRGMSEATAITGDAFRAALASAAHRPFRVVPFFDPGVWGGYWMSQTIPLAESDSKYAWCFDCVPEENSLLLEDDAGRRVEIPALDLVLREPKALLGERTFARFGAEFPIRFDLLDTMGGGNLSLQVHPLTDYMQRVFGMPYTQDESYYLLDCEDDAVVYLGVRPGVDPEAMLAALRAAEAGGEPFDAERFVNKLPVRKHDHLSIPAGTVHCSGANSMVLEISATPYIFTFKLWDWGRLGLDGRPRPVHIDHGAANIQWDRDLAWVESNLLERAEVLSAVDGHTHERTGLHELEFIETRRHWFERPIDLDTDGTVHVVNLVEGDAASVTSPIGAFEPFEVHYAETFIVPAAVGPFRLEPADGVGRCGAIVASVRGTRER